jgi:hypothetical protein
MCDRRRLLVCTSSNIVSTITFVFRSTAAPHDPSIHGLTPPILLQRMAPPTSSSPLLVGYCAIPMPSFRIPPGRPGFSMAWGEGWQ